MEGCEREALSTSPTPLDSPLREAGVCALHRGQLDAAMELAATVLMRERRLRPTPRREVAG